jgi:hypothetical protein
MNDVSHLAREGGWQICDNKVYEGQLKITQICLMTSLMNVLIPSNHLLSNYDLLWEVINFKIQKISAK